MRKSCLFIAAGAAVMICGCRTAVTGPKRVIPASPDPVAVEPAPFTPGSRGYEAVSKPQPQPQQVAAPRFAPLEGAVSSGGVDSAPRRKVRGKKVSGKSGKIAAPGGVYVIQSGDTPDRIARRHGVRLSALMAANNLDQKAARRLQIGQKLVIPGKDAKAVVSAKKATGKSAAAAVAADGKYVVQSGDTPDRIARKHRVRLSELLKANNLDPQSARRLQIGQKLIIPGKTVAPAAEIKNEVKPPVVVDQPPVVEQQPVVVESQPPVVVDQPPVTPVAPPVADAPVPTDGGDSESEVEMLMIETNTTAAELAAKYNIPAEVISQKNSGKTEFPKGDVIFIPKK